MKWKKKQQIILLEPLFEKFLVLEASLQIISVVDVLFNHENSSMLWECYFENNLWMYPKKIAQCISKVANMTTHLIPKATFYLNLNSLKE